MLTSMFLSLLSFAKFTGPANVEKKEWDRQNQALKANLAPLHQEIANAPTNNSEYIETLDDRLTSVIRQFFEENSAFFEAEASTSTLNKFISHKNSTMAQLENIKKNSVQKHLENMAVKKREKGFMNAFKLSVN